MFGCLLLVGIYAERLLDIDLPGAKMQQVYRLLGLARRYGPGPVDQACARALELDVVNVTKIASMLEGGVACQRDGFWREFRDRGHGG